VTEGQTHRSTLSRLSQAAIRSSGVWRQELLPSILHGCHFDTINSFCIKIFFPNTFYQTSHVENNFRLIFNIESHYGELVRELRFTLYMCVSVIRHKEHLQCSHILMLLATEAFAGLVKFNTNLCLKH
jgi:hypothetical protein